VPGTTIDMLRNGNRHAQVVADASGLFAIISPPLPPGSHEVVLEAIGIDEARTRSRQSVTIVINPDLRTKPLVALTAPDQPTLLLSSAEQADPKTTDPRSNPSAERELKIATVDWEDSGRVFISGRGQPGAAIRLYMNDGLVSTAVAGSDGRVSFAVGPGVLPGNYRIRLEPMDPVTAGAKALAEGSFTTPVQFAASPSVAPQPKPASMRASASVADQSVHTGTVAMPAADTVTVSKQENLWQISRRTYGAGHRYTVIYQANRGQIRRSDLIYPGQVFLLPTDPSAKTK